MFRTPRRPSHRPFGRLGVELLESRDVPSAGLTDPKTEWVDAPKAAVVSTASPAWEDVLSQRYVTRLYQDVLGRTPEPAGLNLWVTALDTGALTRGQVAVQFVASEEYRTNTVVSYFQLQLGRSPDTAELQFYLNRLRAGESQDALRVSFFGSEEFFNRYGRNGTQFVIQLYAQILGRTATAADVNFWVNVLNQTGGNRTFVAAQFLGSLEYHQVQVFGAYTLLLRHPPDAFGFAFWTFQRQSGMTIETMVVNFLGSNEYYLRP